MSLHIDLVKKYHISYDNGLTLLPREETVYDCNITHNLGKMAEKAGIYEALWRPYRLKPNYVHDEDYEIEMKFENENPSYAFEIIEILEKGLEKLHNDPKYYKQFDSPNGWGLYKHFVPFVEKYLEACKNFPETTIKCDR